MKKYDSKPYKLPDYPDTDTDVLEEEEIDAEEIVNLENHLVLYNDDVTTFQEVEEALQEICHHTELQSKQCALIIHNKGKCSVKQGSYKKLKPMLEAMLDRKISAIIE